MAMSILNKTDLAMPPQASLYQNWCNVSLRNALIGANPGWRTCYVAPILFKASEPVNMINDLPDCTLLVFADTGVGSPFYILLFMPKETLMPIYTTTGNLFKIVEVYQSKESLDREEQFVTTMSIAGGTIFGAALDSILGWFGYSMHTTKDVKHINAI